MESTKLFTYSLRDLFEKRLRLPPYQRSYSWLATHVRDLLDDTFGRTRPYLMGTIILHQNDEDGAESLPFFDVVDGQQRLVTLTVILHVLQNKLGLQPSNAFPLLGSEFPEGAARTIQKTKTVVDTFLDQYSPQEQEDYLDLLLSPKGDDSKSWLEFSTLVLSGTNALDNAYVFFDSMNSKGKQLTDFDLLKAHHLMFIPPRQEALATNHNGEWQSSDADHELVFSTILRRLRMWSRGDSRDSRQERPDYNEFVSVVDPGETPDDEHLFNRYMQPAAFRSWRRAGQEIIISMDYPPRDAESMIPTEVTQTIEGGDAFFLYAKRYHKIYKGLFSSDAASTEILFVRKMAEHIQNTFLRNAFRAVILLSYDKFGEKHLAEIAVHIERIISARRWDPRGFRIEGALDHIRDHKLVPILLNSVKSSHVISQLHSIARTLPSIQGQDLSGVRQWSFQSMCRFYREERSKIFDPRCGLVSNFYPSN